MGLDNILTFIFFLFLLILIPPPVKPQPYTEITLGSSLVAKEGGSWVSLSGDFAFGFYPISYGFLLAIWFNKIPQKTIVWSANREAPVQARSRVDLTKDGHLQLLDSKGQLIWSIEVADVDHAAMLDSGNFVLVGRSSSMSDLFMWQSFENPTDTILPSQVMYADDKQKPLIAQLSETNFSEGHFTLEVFNGNIGFYNLGTRRRKVKYWSIETQSKCSRLVFDKSGSIYWVQLNETLRNLSTGSSYSTRDFYQRAILEYDGVFRQYIYSKDQTKKDDWRKVWHLPKDICNVREQPTTSLSRGSCGFNTICKENNSRSTCVCAPGYSYINHNDTRGGCNRDYVGKCNSPFEVVALPNINWIYADSYYYNVSDEKECQNSCKDDCLCDVVVYQSLQQTKRCWRKVLPLANGMEDFIGYTVGFVKVWKNSSSSTNHSSTTNYLTPLNEKNQGNKWLGVGSVLIGTSIFIFLITCGVVFFFYLKHHRYMQQYNSLVDDNVSESRLHCFTYKELEKATDGFKTKVGEGGFGAVYKGKLSVDNKASIAVKVLNKFKEQGDRDFEAEVKSIGQSYHRNLVRLLGYCKDNDHRLLVYEFMSNGSLANFMLDYSRLIWSKRTQIAYDIAKGLLYLHEDCNTQIIHCDIKPENVLLDDSFNARISDFGMAKLLTEDQTKTFTVIRGTIGYLAPEWFKSTAVTAKVDVYSFGVVLLRILCCMKNVTIECAYSYYKEGRLSLLVENDEEAMANLRAFEKCMLIAFWCVQEDPALRPSMKGVTRMLEGCYDIPVPPNPSIHVGPSFE